MKDNITRISIGEMILGIGLFMAIFGVITSIMLYEPGIDLQGFAIWTSVTILLLAIGTYAILIKSFKDLNNIEGKISAIVNEIKRR